MKFLSNLLPQHVKLYAGTILKWFLIGYLIRVTLMPLLWHGDLLVDGWISFILKEYHQLVNSNTPPLFYYFLALLYALLGPIFPKTVFSDVTLQTGFTSVHLAEPLRLSQPGIWAFIFISKMIAFPFDFGLALLLLHLLNDDKRALLAFKLWMVNPVTILFLAQIGARHAIPTFLFTFALYFLRKPKIGWAMVLLGLAGAFNPFFLLFVPAVAYTCSKSQGGFATKAKELSLMLATGLLPFVAVSFASFLTPVYYESVNAAAPRDFDFNGFFGKTQYYRGQPGQPLLSGIFFFFLNYSASLKTLEGFGDVIYFLPLIYGLFLLGIVYWKDWPFEKIWKAMLVFFLAYYSFVLFHPWWFLWSQPLLILLVVENRGKFLSLYFMLSALLIIYTGYWNLPFIEAMRNVGLPAVQVINLFRSIMSAIMMFIAYLILRDIIGGATK